MNYYKDLRNKILIAFVGERIDQYCGLPMSLRPDAPHPTMSRVEEDRNLRMVADIASSLLVKLVIDHNEEFGIDVTAKGCPK